MANINMLNVKYIIVFKEDGLMKDEVRKDLLNYGTIIKELEDTLEDGEGVWMVFMDSEFHKYFRIKLDYNCLESNYVLWPMENYYEKVKAERMMQ